MKITLSKSQWEFIGQKTGWLKPLLKEAKNTKNTKKKKSPKQHGFIDQCIKKNKDKDNPGAYCASIVDKVKGTTKWRSNTKNKSKNKKASQTTPTIKIAQFIKDNQWQCPICKTILEKTSPNQSLDNSITKHLNSCDN